MPIHPTERNNIFYLDIWILFNFLLRLAYIPLQRSVGFITFIEIGYKIGIGKLSRMTLVCCPAVCTDGSFLQCAATQVQIS